MIVVIIYCHGDGGVVVCDLRRWWYCWR